MLQFLQHVMHVSDPEQLLSLDASAFAHPGIHLYWKDKKGAYMGCNNSQAMKSGFKSGGQILGLTDYDMSWSCFAPEIVANDLNVISKEQVKSMIEPVRSYDNKEYKFYSIKFPLRLRNRKVSGVIGISIQLNDTLIPNSIYQLASNKLDQSAETVDFSVLSKRQQQCLYYLVRGMSIKEIAIAMHLSPKTVEHYLEAVRHKFNCDSRSELIMKATRNLIIPIN